ncbi:unnamed protein product [Boreogadus saida]
MTESSIGQCSVGGRRRSGRGFGWSNLDREKVQLVRISVRQNLVGRSFGWSSFTGRTNHEHHSSFPTGVPSSSGATARIKATALARHGWKTEKMCEHFSGL